MSSWNISWSSLWQWLWPSLTLYESEYVVDSHDVKDSEVLQVNKHHFELLPKQSQQLDDMITRGVAGEIDQKKPPQSTNSCPTPQNHATSSQGRYRSIIRRLDQNTGLLKDIEAETVDKDLRTKDVAFTFRRVYPSRDGEDIRSELEIEDPALIQLLKSIVDPYPGINFLGEFVMISQPFAPIVHNWDGLLEKTKVNPESLLTQDLICLLRRVETAPELENYFKTRDIYLAAKVTTWDYIWTVFKPGERVVASPFLDEPQILEIASSPLPLPPKQAFISTNSSQVPTSGNMVVWCWDWTGKRMRKTYYPTSLEYFVGTKPIAELPLYPVRYHNDLEQLYATIWQRAERFLAATLNNKEGGGKLFDYQGLAYEMKKRSIRDGEDYALPTLAPPPIEGNLGNQKVNYIQGQVMADAEEFINTHGIRPLSNWHSIPFVARPESEEQEANRAFAGKGTPGERDSMLLLPPRFLGYATREKAWGQFSVQLTTPPAAKSGKKFEDDLQLHGNSKELIWALVTSHQAKQSSQIEDVVRNKGKGLVLLFHGGPGVGKTLTAETIAEATGRPLYIVSVAEVGLDATNAERNLIAHFDLATRWQAILLMDEADVFLETRDATSTEERNALVSVLLRVLEYYQGILILTTNRVKAIDIAVISRIHLAVHYPDLEEPQVRRIFKYFLDQIAPLDIKDREKIDNFIELSGHSYRFNGRQIRNVVTGALAAAQNELELKKPGADGKLTYGHLKTLSEMTRSFQEQLREYTNMQRGNREAK